MKPLFANHYWGCMFSKFYGQPVCEDYFSKTSASIGNVTDFTYTFSSGAVLTRSDVERSRRNSPEREFFLLLESEKIFEWCKICELTPEGVFADYDLNCLPEGKGNLIDVDAKTVGCKYSLDDLREQLRAKHPIEVRDNEYLEHCWVLSNSCGEVVDPLDVKRFKHLTFGENFSSRTEPLIGSSLSDYLSHCLTVLERSKLPSATGETRMKDDWLAFCVEYLSNTDLNYKRKEDNPLLTALLYEVIEKHHLYVSNYAQNVKNFSFFLNNALPTIEIIWEFRWLKKPRDHRLLFEFTMSDASDGVLPTLNLNDLTVILSEKVVRLERLIHDSNIIMLKGIIGAILMEENPEADEGFLWICFHCYYAQYRTAVTRVVPRPKIYSPPFQVSFSRVVMAGVEEFFTQIQSKHPGINVRRQFCGRMAIDAFMVFKRLGLCFPTLASVVVPPELRYLCVDYYKWVDSSKLNDKETSVLTTIHKSVDRMCIDRLVNTRGASALRTPKYEILSGKLYKQAKNINEYGRQSINGRGQRGRFATG
nr:P60 [Carrot closterovirus 2]